MISQDLLNSCIKSLTASVATQTSIEEGQPRGIPPLYSHREGTACQAVAAELHAAITPA